MKNFPLSFLAAVSLAGSTCTMVNAQADVPSLLDGAYTEEQAIRGQVVYYEQCLVCHGEMMNGLDQAPPLAGPQFTGVWNGESLWAMVERIDTMPPNMPGSLSRQDTVDVLTYILWYNGLPLGNAALATDQKKLAEMEFEIPAFGQ